MVIPVQGGTLRGPIPAELAPQFVWIKYATIVMMVSYTVRLAYDVVCVFDVNLMGDVLIDMNLLLNVMIGIWLMKDDPTIKKAYDFLTANCCYQCGQNCPGSMACLLLFAVINFFSVVMAAIRSFDHGSEFAYFCTYLTGLPDILSNDDLEFKVKLAKLLLLVYTTAYVVLHVAMLVGTVFAYQAYKVAIELGLSQDPMMLGGQGDSLLGNGFDRQPFGGAGSRLGDGRDQGRSQQAGQGQQQSGRGSYRPPSAPPQQQRFVPFQGQGHSLGSG